jgi:hypothetical protein
MAMLVISTQVRENYGAHDWDGEGTCPQYWKFKGGHEYKITGIPLNGDLSEIVEMVRGDVTEDNDYYEEYILDWEVQNDDYLSWYEESQLEYDGEIRYPEPTMEYSDLQARYAEAV